MNNVENENVTLKTEKGTIKIFEKGIYVLALAASAIVLSRPVDYFVECATTDHCKEYCPLSNWFGLQHQANKINGMSTHMDAHYYTGEKDDTFYVENSNKLEIANVDGKIYVPWYGELKEYEPKGERVEVYMTDPYEEDILVRVFKRK